MKQDTEKALLWIVKILNKLNIPYRIGGGLAVYLYGHDREINDIDISIDGNHFKEIIPFVEKYITAGPKHYKNKKWDCFTLSLNYKNQDIDITDSQTLLMSSKDGKKWIKNKKIYKKHQDKIIKFNGVSIPIMDPRVLIEYKKELIGKHQEEDILFLQKYLKNTS
jgi:hypothetical protein